MTLVIMAAGMGSRFGGLKQLEPVGSNGEFIIDYSIYDAIKAGFTKVVFIIKKENYELFRDTVGKRIEGKIQVEYVFQENSNLPSSITLPDNRVKPLGTGHALYCAKDKVNEPFAVISADDFYGRESFELLGKFLIHSNNYCLIGYKLGNTLATSGAVKRGVCFEDNGLLTKIVESKVEEKDGMVACTSILGGDQYMADKETTVSMLMFGLQPGIFDYIDKDIVDYFNNNKDSLDTIEYYLPEILGDMIKRNLIKMEVIKTNAEWKGVTYYEDLNDLKEYIQLQVKNNVYPSNLYE